MNKLIQYLALAGAVTVAGQASAAPITLTGSDTEDVLISSVISSGTCSGADSTTISYTGGGSGTGEQNMLAQKQQTAPMSRGLQASRTCRSTNPKAAECKVIALDGIAMVAANSTNGTGACNGISVAGQTVPTTTYTLNGPFDALRLIYAGMDQNAGSTIGNKNCSNPVRTALINNWGSVFTAGCTSGSCTKLSHAYRRGDASGTTDTFLTLLGLTAPIPTVPVQNQVNAMPNPMPPNPFCNGWEREDADPIRSTCGSGAAASDVCQVTAGVVLPVVVPEQLTSAQGYPTKTCDTGKFALVTGRRTVVTGGLSFFECPDGAFPAGKSAFNSSTTNNVGGLCFAPYHLNGTTKEFDCLNVRTNISPTGHDGLAENRFLRNLNGSLVNDSAGAVVGNAYYRMRTAACPRTDSTDQIGCLAATVPCSIGFAGRAADVAGVSPALSVDGIYPTVANIQALVQTPPPVPVYPIARRLNDCTMIGGAAVTAPESNLAACVANETFMGSFIDAAGFVRLPAGADTCVDFDETSCNTLSGVTCATNADCGAFSCVSGTCDFTCATNADCTQPGASCISGHCGFASNSTNTCSPSP